MYERVNATNKMNEPFMREQGLHDYLQNKKTQILKYQGTYMSFFGLTNEEIYHHFKATS